MTTSFKMYLIRRQQAAKQHMCVRGTGGWLGNWVRDKIAQKHSIKTNRNCY